MEIIVHGRWQDQRDRSLVHWFLYSQRSQAGKGKGTLPTPRPLTLACTEKLVEVSHGTQDKYLLLCSFPTKMSLVLQRTSSGC